METTIIESTTTTMATMAALEKCTHWLENLSTISDDVESSSYGESSASSDYTAGECSCSSTGEELTTTTTTGNSEYVCVDVEFSNSANLPSIVGTNCEGEISKLFNKTHNVYNNVRINKSKKVHLGNVTYINGPVYIGNTQNIDAKDRTDLRTNLEETRSFRIVDRINWLAQPPMEDKVLFTEPAKYVIVCHTATEDASTMARNTLLVRLIQMFHLESRNWSDIAYNFLVGCDGNVYEGRGFDTVGAHTKGFNSSSIGIAFIGCFIKKLPPEVALKTAQELIEHGVDIGAISADYRLIGACQCCGTASPGQMLYEEIKSWKNYDGAISVESPPSHTNNNL